jgi:hypothetical protein
MFSRLSKIVAVSLLIGSANSAISEEASQPN